jgi:hypothetical protein
MYPSSWDIVALMIKMFEGKILNVDQMFVVGRQLNIHKTLAWGIP